MLRLQLQHLARRLLLLFGASTNSDIAAKSLANAEGVVTADPHLLGRRAAAGSWWPRCCELLHSSGLMRLQLPLLLGVHPTRFHSGGRSSQRVRPRRGTLGTLGCIL